MAVFPYMQFQPHNPMDTAIRSAMQVYEGLGQGRQRRLQSQMLEKQIPYQEQLLQQQLMRQKFKEAEEAEEMPYLAQNAANQAEKTRIETAMYEEMKRNQIDSAQRKYQNPLLGSSGMAGQIAAYNYLKSIGDPNAELLKQNIDREATGKRDSALMWRGMPQDFKNEQIARAKANGIDATYAAQQYANGRTFEELLNEKGIPLEEGLSKMPDYAPTGATRTNIQKRTGATKELEVFEDFISNAMEPYVSIASVGGMSIPLILDQLAGANEDQQADFWAAYALYPELNYVRIQAAQGNSGITALKHMEERALGNISGAQSLINKNVWKKAQTRLNQKIREGVNSYKQEVYNPGRSGNNKSSEAKQDDLEIMMITDGMSDEELKAIASGVR